VFVLQDVEGAEMIITPFLVIFTHGLLAGVHLGEQKVYPFLYSVALVVIAIGDIFWWGR
jgi:hypothetical protein